MYLYVVTWVPEITFLTAPNLLVEELRYVTRPKKDASEINSLRLPRMLGLEPETELPFPRLSDCTSPGQICATHQRRTLRVFTSPNVTPVWILLSVPTCPPTLWEWPKKQGHGGRVSGGKVTLQNCSRSASLTLKSSTRIVYKSILTASHSRSLMGENWESVTTGNETFTLSLGHSCIWRSKMTAKSGDTM